MNHSKTLDFINYALCFVGTDFIDRVGNVNNDGCGNYDIGLEEV